MTPDGKTGVRERHTWHKTITTYDYDIIGINECRSGVQLTSMQEMLGDTYDFVLYSDKNNPEGYNPILYKKDKFILLESGVFYLNATDLTTPVISWDNSSGNYRFTAYTKLQVKETGGIKECNYENFYFNRRCFEKVTIK